MNDQIRAVVFILLALLILFTWGHFFKPPAPAPAPTGSAISQGGTSPAPSGQPAATILRDSAAAAEKKTASAAAIQAAEEKTIVVESPLYRVEFSNRGGVVRSWKLKKYLTDQKPPRPLDLVNADASKQLGWPFSLVLSDKQLEAQVNAALYEVTPAATGASADLQAPTEVTFHWSDGHADVMKKLSFTPDYELTVECAVTVDGKAVSVALAWRGGFGDKEVYNAAQLVNVFYKQNDKLNLLQYKKLGVSGNQSEAAVQSGPLEYLGIEDQFFTAAFLPDGTNLSLWHWMQTHDVQADGKTVAEPEAEMAAGTAEPAALKTRVFVGPKDLTLLSKVQPPLEELVQFGWTGIIAKPIFEILKWIHRLRSELRMGDRDFDAHHQYGDFSVEDEELALDAENAESGAGNPPDSGSLQEIFDERSAQEKDERRSDGGLSARGHQSDGKLHSRCFSRCRSGGRYGGC